MSGRKAQQQPATLWDYRRMKALVDVLAISSGYFELREGLNHLLKSWGLPIILHEPIDQTVQRLAKYVQTEGRNNYEEQKVD